MTIGSWALKFKLESDLGWYFCFLELVCRSGLSIIEGSRHHHEATSIQLRTILYDYWEFRAQNLTGIRSRILVLFFGIGASLRPLDRGPHWEIEMPLVKRPAYRFHRTVLCDYWELRVQNWTRIRSRMVFLFFGIGVSFWPLDRGI